MQERGRRAAFVTGRVRCYAVGMLARIRAKRNGVFRYARHAGRPHSRSGQQSARYVWLNGYRRKARVVRRKRGFAPVAANEEKQVCPTERRVVSSMLRSASRNGMRLHVYRTVRWRW